MATEKENIEPEYRLRTIESLSRHIESALRYQHTATSRTTYTLHRVFKCFNLRYYESYVTGLYLVNHSLTTTNQSYHEKYILGYKNNVRWKRSNKSFISK